ncbi:structural protein [Pseudomonas lundensis]|uniref:structural protein n=1 Tax=Pseudomonas lundensis TaxID=86185 RepID=UPI000BA26079|nr:structural protein [Pseudomonas lundensis]OZY31072.1 structural protein [Pseudomonas lundensis]
MSTPRGIRNNNPGNIDYNPANAWQGQLKPDPAIEKRFARFDTPENGIRALGKLLRTYQRKHGLKTVKAIISRWAPSLENDTTAYVRSVESKIPGVKSGADVDVSSPLVMRAFVVAIIEHENANYQYVASVIDEGVRRALA